MEACIETLVDDLLGKGRRKKEGRERDGRREKEKEKEEHRRGLENR